MELLRDYITKELLPFFIHKIPGDLDAETLVAFSNHFTDLVCHRAIYLQKVGKDAYDSMKESVEKRVVDASLIASGVSKDALESIMPLTSEEMNFSQLVSVKYARKVLAKMDTKTLNAPLLKRLEWSRNYICENPQSDPNAYELIELMIAQHEREAGYIPAEMPEYAFAYGACQGMWRIRKEQFEDPVHYPHLQNASLAYQICSDLYRDTSFRPYPQMTAFALKKMAGIDLYVAQFGIDAFDNREELKTVLEHVEAAKLVQPSLISRYELQFRTKMAPHIERFGLELTTGTPVIYEKK